MIALTSTDLQFIQQLQAIILQDANILAQAAIPDETEFSAEALAAINSAVTQAANTINNILYGSTPLITDTATDAPYTVTSAKFIILPAITANRIITLPSLPAGSQLTIWNKNNSGFHWSFAANVKDPTSTTFTQLVNQTFYSLIYDGTSWVSNKTALS